MPSDHQKTSPIIGTLNEKPLHAALKSLLAKPSDKLEELVDGYVIDILRDDTIIEIQTKSFSKIRKKITHFLKQYQVRLVYPIAREKWIIRLDQDGETQLSRRKSPKRGRYLDIFSELVSFPQLIENENLMVEIFLIQEDEVRKHVPGRAWRRKGWITQERRLIDVIDRRRFFDPGDFVALVPPSIQGEFTTADLASNLGIPSRLAGQMTYCLREMGALELRGKRGRAYLYTRT